MSRRSARTHSFTVKKKHPAGLCVQKARIPMESNKAQQRNETPSGKWVLRFKESSEDEILPPATTDLLGDHIVIALSKKQVLLNASKRL